VDAKNACNMFQSESFLMLMDGDLTMENKRFRIGKRKKRKRKLLFILMVRKEVKVLVIR